MLDSEPIGDEGTVFEVFGSETEVAAVDPLNGDRCHLGLVDTFTCREMLTETTSEDDGAFSGKAMVFIGD